jgi:long-chain fatty acid transport protein
MTAGLIMAAAALPRAAEAQGYGVYEQGACVMGRAGTGVASACADGSSIFFNPAGITAAERQQLSVGGTLIAPRGTFTNDLSGFTGSLKAKAYPVPNLYYVRPLGGGRAAAGIGLFAPYGLTTEWPDDFEGRFLGYKSRIAAIYVQPTAAFKLGKRASIGAGLDVSFVKVELRQRLELSSQIAAPPSPVSLIYPAFAAIDLGSSYDMNVEPLNSHGTRASGCSYLVYAGLLRYEDTILSYGIDAPEVNVW